MTLREMLIEIKFFGLKPTLDSIEKISSATLRKQTRMLFEEALILLQNSEYDFRLMDFPATQKPEEN